ncbi:MAG: hypothetical protein PWQ79_232 [Thermococcaceae archaeon]|nr:hypothetical protein [Thermococcaceae archaeon]
MKSFNHFFVGIGHAGSLVVEVLDGEGVNRIGINPAYYLLSSSRNYEDRLRNFFSNIPEDSFLWLVFEDKTINLELVSLIMESLPQRVIKLAYVLTPRKELVKKEKPNWADGFETVFYDSFWEFLRSDVPIHQAYSQAARAIGRMFTKLHYYLENEMLVNIDYADLFNMIKGGNVGILRILRGVDFKWHWGIWDRGLIALLIGEEAPLKDAHGILAKFQEILSEKDVIWGVVTDPDLGKEAEILALLVKRW